jgi:aminocarboxymuconate-semialdehyde decarboxylase
MLLCHACGHHHGAGVAATPARPRLPHVTLDLHCHLAVPAVEQLVAAEPAQQADAARYAEGLGAPSVQTNRDMRQAIGVRLQSIDQRLADMDRLGIDVQVLSPSPMQYHYWAEPELAARISSLVNTQLAGVVDQRPDRFLALAHVPLQHPELAAQVLHEAMGLGLLGAEISSDPTGQGLDDAALAPFWQAAEELGAVLFLHPMGTSVGARLNRYYLSNVIGQPLETTIALAQLVHGGVLDRHPRLKVCAAHGGGFLPFAPGRFDHGFGVRPEAQACARPPSEYLRQLWFDTVVFRPDAVRTLLDIAGPTQVVAGTDYPFDMGEYALHALVEAVPGLDDEARARVLGGNAIELLGLDREHPALVAARRRIGVTA